jgi:polyisoprenoid-binding protein YceI
MENTNSTVASTTQSTNGGGALYVVDARRSRFTVQAFATGILSAMGHNPTIGIRTFAGQVRFDPEALRGSEFRLTVQAASLSVEDDISDKDRREIERMMQSDVLEIDKYPEIRYEAPSPIAINRVDFSLFSATLNGSLSLHGITRNESFPVRILTMGEMLRTSGEFILKQSNYQIKPVSVAGGALKVKDELRFSFEMVANRQEPSS